jgi:hypothetical protein
VTDYVIDASNGATISASGCITATNAAPPTGVATKLNIDAGTVLEAKATPKTGIQMDSRTVTQEFTAQE